MDVASKAVEAFLDLGDGESLHTWTCSAGYRLIGTGEVVCAIKLPLAVAEAAILRRSRISIVLTAAGRIQVFAGGA
jgi:GH24 family phage-related lysozyme (muramidase)